MSETITDLNTGIEIKTDSSFGENTKDLMLSINDEAANKGENKAATIFNEFVKIASHLQGQTDTQKMIKVQSGLIALNMAMQFIGKDETKVARLVAVARGVSR